jgi:ketosteroid isomerase-like protein
MRRFLIIVVLILAARTPVVAQPAADRSRAQIDAFNRKLEEATQRMDNAATMDLWADDGVSLLPSTPPMVGKAAIGVFLNGVTAQIKGATMLKFEMQCSGIEVSGKMATEWCSEHQVVQMPGGKPPFDGHGRMLLVLRRGADGDWKLLREMWIPAEAES